VKENNEKINFKESTQLMLPFISKYKISYILGIVVLIVNSLLLMILPKITNRTISLLQSGSFDLKDISFYSILIIIIAIGVMLCRWGWRLLILKPARYIVHQFRKNIFEHLINLDDKFYKRSKLGDLMANVTNDLESIRMAIGISLVTLVDSIFISLGIIIILFFKDPYLAFFVILPYPIFTFLSLFIGNISRKYFKKIQDYFGIMSQQVQESFAGINVIKTFVKEDYFLQKFTETNKIYQETVLKTVLLWGIVGPIITIIAGVSEIMLLKIGGTYILEGSFSIGDLVEILSYLAMLIWPFLAMGNFMNMMQRGMASLDRVNKVLSYIPEFHQDEGELEKTINNKIEVKNLSFQYHDGNSKVLDDISFDMKKGEILGVLGGIGSGKSTLIKALIKTLKTERGMIFYDDIDINKYYGQSLRRDIAVVPQISFLFSDTIKNNIVFALEDKNDNELIQKVADLTTLTRDIAMFKDGLETEVGEKGVSLSGGQKQRVALARALATDAHVLILDDSMSALDTETEEKILNSIFKERQDKFTILVSNRISTLSNSHKTIVLKNGKITQQGTHKELLNQEGFYQDIYNMQKIEDSKKEL